MLALLDGTAGMKNDFYVEAGKQLTFTQLLSILSDAFAIIRQDGTYLEVNEGFIRMSGFRREELLNKKCSDLGLWLDAKEQRLFEKMLRHQGKVRDMIVKFCHRNGHTVYGLLSVCSISFNGKRCYVAVVRDVSELVLAEQERKQQEEDLLISRNKLSAAAGLVGLGPWEYEPDLDIFKFEDEFYALYLTNTACEGRYMSFDTYVSKFVHPEDRLLLKNEKDILTATDLECPADITHRIIQQGGGIRHVLVRRRFTRNSIGQIIRVHGINQDITEWVSIEKQRSQQAELITQMAYFDSLTGLANRHSLNEYLDREMEQAKLGNTAGSILFIDIDDLKLVNDTCGHTAGDMVIALIASRLQKIVPEDAFVARLGSDEFIVVLRELHDRNKIRNIATNISNSLKVNHENSGTRFQLTVSIGIAIFPYDGDSREEIIKNADNAMYAAKEGGKNSCRFYTEGMLRETYRRIQLIDGLRCGLERGEYALVYQPQINITTGRVSGFEALLRWNSAEYGSVPPLQFIPIAEQSGLIHSIGKWVLNEGCLFARRLVDKGWDNICVAVNVSAKQVEDDNFIAIVRNAIQKAGIKPQMLGIELTESICMSSLERANAKLMQLKQLGIPLLLDDFGTGFSSLSYLFGLPFETLKIDKSFIDVIASDSKRAKVISSIIGMAHTMNMNVIAEGVETESQLEYLSANGCGYAQGYLFSKPLTEADAIRFMAEEREAFSLS